MTGRAQRIPGRKHQPSLRLVERAPETRPGCAARRTHSVPASGHGDAEALAAVRRHGQHGALARRSGGQAGLSGHRLGPGERRRPQDRSGAWLGTAAAGLAVLAGAAATVSFSAQYQMVHAARGVVVVAALEAAIPDTAALIFASLGIALALHGRRAVRSRLLNLASIGTSVVMNVLAAAPGWRDLAIWALPPVAYALASDTLISVVRATAIARHQDCAAGGRRRAHTAGPHRRAAAVADPASGSASVDAAGPAGVGAGRVPGRARAAATRLPRLPLRAGARPSRCRRSPHDPLPRSAGLGPEPRPRGSWPWSAASTARSRRSRWPTCQRSPPRSRRESG